mgnify:CR=1 FL=1|tara:strand:+ start:400 stop:642 length:243 start_codon:yes stop_codon:yes gene_type:complete
MSNLSVTDASTFTLLQELMTRLDNEGDKLFSINTLLINKDNSLLITGIAVKKPIYITEKKQEPIPGSQVPPIKGPFGEEE